MGTREIEHEGLLAVELVDGGLRLVIVHQVGPRIAWLGFEGGENLLFWDPRGEHGRGDWWLRGGHRLWVTRPLADETEETYAADNRPCRVVRLEDGVAVIAPPDAHRLEKTLHVRVEGGRFVVSHQVRNTGELLWSGGIRAVTCTRPEPGTSYRVPFGEPSAWDVITVVIPRRWGGHTSAVADPQVVLGEDALVVNPLGWETRRMIQARPGRIEMVDTARGSFAKEARFERGAPYPLDTNLALHVGPGNFMVETETLSPIRQVAPDESIVHTEVWTLTR